MLSNVNLFGVCKRLCCGVIGGVANKAERDNGEAGCDARLELGEEEEDDDDDL